MSDTKIVFAMKFMSSNANFTLNAAEIHIYLFEIEATVFAVTRITDAQRARDGIN